MPLNLTSIENWNSDKFIVKNISNEYLSIGDLKVYLAPGSERDLLEQNPLTKIKSRTFPEIAKSKNLHLYIKLEKIEIYDEHGLISGEENASNLSTYTTAYDVAGVSSNTTIINENNITNITNVTNENVVNEENVTNQYYTVTLSDSSILVNTTTTLLMPDTSTIPNKVYHIKNIGTGIVTIQAYENQTIDGGNTAVLESQYESITLISDGENFYIH